MVKDSPGGGRVKRAPTAMCEGGGTLALLCLALLLFFVPGEPHPTSSSHYQPPGTGEDKPCPRQWSCPHLLGPSGTPGASLLMVLATVELGTLINSSLEKKGESHVSRTSIVCTAAADPCVLPWKAKLQCRSETWLLPAGISWPQGAYFQSEANHCQHSKICVNAMFLPSRDGLAFPLEKSTVSASWHGWGHTKNL